KTWARVSANCPSYPRGIPAAPTASKAPLQEDPTSTIGYPNVAAALKGLRSRSDMVVMVQNGWIIAEDQTASEFWSFPPPGHPAYPAAVKRQFVHTPNGTELDMRVHCEASKQACDDLVQAFKQLNSQMEAEIRARSSSSAHP